MKDIASEPIHDLLRHTLNFCSENLNRGDLSSAHEALGRALNLAPNDPEILSQHGRLAFALKDSGTAQRDFAKALKIDPRCAAAWSGFATWHRLRGETAEAVAAAERALEIDPADEEAARTKAEVQTERRAARPCQSSNTRSQGISAKLQPAVSTFVGNPPSEFAHRDPATEANPWMAKIYGLRNTIAAPYIKGRGMEIGAGLNPMQLPAGTECIYFDKRGEKDVETLFGAPIDYKVHDISEVGRLFPKGADFLLANQVLEHSCDPIGTLINWHSYVRDGGIMVLSLPNYQHCSDSKRLVPPFRHVLADHIFQRGEDGFESREHLYSFLLGWFELMPSLKDLDARRLAEHCLSEGRRKGPQDFHWHAFDTELLEKVITTACLMGGSGAEFLEKDDPYGGKNKTYGDIIFVYRVLRNRLALINGTIDPAIEIDLLREDIGKLQDAHRLLAQRSHLCERVTCPHEPLTADTKPPETICAFDQTLPTRTTLQKDVPSKGPISSQAVRSNALYYSDFANGETAANEHKRPGNLVPASGLQSARLDFEQDRVEAALHGVNGMLACDSQNVDALMFAANCYHRLGDIPRTREACLKALRLAPGSSEITFLLNRLPASGLALDHLDSCPVCASSSFHKVFELPDCSFPLRLHQCDCCEFVFMSPRLTPASIKEVEEDNSFYAYPPDVLRNEISKRVELIRSFERYKRPPGRMVDIGCNRGLLLEAARVAGWTPFGIDISDSAIRQIKRDFGLEAWCGSLDTFAPPQPFDLCVAWHVMEHTTAPSTFLANLRRLLATTGVLALQVPCFGRLKEFSTENRIYSLVNKVHNFHFTSATLGRLVKAAGFQILQLLEGPDHMLTVFATKP